MENNTVQYKRTLRGSVVAGVGALLSGDGRRYYILEHKDGSQYHKAGESQKIIIDQVELGRDANCQVRFGKEYTTVSRRHAAIVRDGERWKLVQLSQTNQTLLNGQAVATEHYLENGDEIQLSPRGPRLGFIVPAGGQSLVSNIKMTERLELFRKQALRPYKTAIAVLVVLLVLAVGGLGTWNIMEHNYWERQVALAQQEIAKLDSINKAQMSIIENNAQKHEQLIKETTSNNNKLKKQNFSLRESYMKQMQSGGGAVKDDASPAQEKSDQAHVEPSDGTVSQEQPSAPSTESSSSSETEKPASPGTDKKEDKESVVPKAPNEPVAPVDKVVEPDIDDCNPYVFFFSVKKIVVTLKDGRKEESPCAWVGSGFLLDDGRFVTAKHCIVFWQFNPGVKQDPATQRWIGTDDRGQLNLQVNNDATDVTVYFSAVSSSGMKFEFTNKDFIMLDTNDQVGNLENSDQQLHLSPIDYTDWAYIQTDLKGQGLKANVAWSMSPKVGTKLRVLGYPHGYVSEDIKPLLGSCTVARSGLDRGRITITERNFEGGNSGGPVLLMQGGRIEVIGLISAGLSETIGFIVPIGNVKTK